MAGKNVIFFQGGGAQEDYDADAKLVASLKSKLGAAYVVHYPLLPNDGTPDLGRRKQIGDEIAKSEDGVLLVGHSFGASMLLVYLSENKLTKKIAGIFLISTPFWTGDEDWVQAFMLQPDFVKKLPAGVPVFFYHCRDDEEVPFAQFESYRKALPLAAFREIAVGGHQLSNDLAIVAKDIKSVMTLKG
jgi:predicted alpha/beta hydrolase family esterase